MFEKPDSNLNSNIKLYFHDRFVDWIFVRFLPRWITPNHFTLSRFLLTPFVFYLIIGDYLKWGITLFILTALTDLIDGVMARVRKQITRWGTVYDPVSDKFLITGVLLILIVRHTNIYLSSTIIGLELIYIIAGFALKRHGILKPATVLGKSKMVLQCVGIFFILFGLLTLKTVYNDIAQILLVLSVCFSFINLYKHGLGM